MNHQFALKRFQRGFNLIELMITLLLGLLVVLAAISMFISSRRLYTTTENMSRLQESARVAFELMARDLREAGGNACSTTCAVASTMTGTDARRPPLLLHPGNKKETTNKNTPKPLFTSCKYTVITQTFPVHGATPHYPDPTYALPQNSTVPPHADHPPTAPHQHAQQSLAP